MFDFSWPRKPLEKFKQGATLGSITTLIVGAGLTAYIGLFSGYELRDQLKTSNQTEQMSKIERTIHGPITEKEDLNNKEVENYLSKIFDASSLVTKGSSEYITKQKKDSTYKKIFPEDSRNYLSENLVQESDSSNYILTSFREK